ncbi:hypothetical protein NDU88_006624 [Pleurodeles waltl]|uniref:Uncharacterized protein n=1 Tax=Pleurodeles waltl TaxID=8319 RepID=A0AAV7MZS9_PLEWA|nr:hypothetical protein NDU88_006624 [Pleurodeles waltl]
MSPTIAPSLQHKLGLATRPDPKLRPFIGPCKPVQIGSLPWSTKPLCLGVSASPPAARVSLQASDHSCGPSVPNQAAGTSPNTTLLLHSTQHRLLRGLEPLLPQAQALVPLQRLPAMGHTPPDRLPPLQPSRSASTRSGACERTHLGQRTPPLQAAQPRPSSSRRRGVFSASGLAPLRSGTLRGDPGVTGVTTICREIRRSPGYRRFLLARPAAPSYAATPVAILAPAVIDLLSLQRTSGAIKLLLTARPDRKYFTTTTLRRLCKYRNENVMCHPTPHLISSFR